MSFLDGLIANLAIFEDASGTSLPSRDISKSSWKASTILYGEVVGWGHDEIYPNFPEPYINFFQP